MLKRMSVLSPAEGAGVDPAAAAGLHGTPELGLTQRKLAGPPPCSTTFLPVSFSPSLLLSFSPSLLLSLSLSLLNDTTPRRPSNSPNEHDALPNAMTSNGIGSRLDKTGLVA